MRIVITGAAGFIGGVVARQLRARGDEVVAIVRDPARAAGLNDLGVTLVTGDLGQVGEIALQLAGADALIHIAGTYRIGIPPSARPAMLDANVGVTTRVLDAAAQAGTPRIVYTSTVLVLGDTHGVVADETHQRDLAEGFFSYYDETKYRAHELVAARISAGAPILIAMPGGVYGPGDHSEAGGQFALAHAGRMPYVALADIGLGWTYVDDVADGIVRVLDRGRIGESYLLSGPPGRLRDGLQIAARLGGKRLPRLTLPTGLLRLLIPFNRRFGTLGGLPANLAETISAADGVTYWGDSTKAERELGFHARDLESGLRATFAT
jgi:nucleoside-diphosphate-sugar epimerase